MIYIVESHSHSASTLPMPLLAVKGGTEKSNLTGMANFHFGLRRRKLSEVKETVRIQSSSSPWE
jgi:hypothetical protein